MCGGRESEGGWEGGGELLQYEMGRCKVAWGFLPGILEDLVFSLWYSWWGVSLWVWVQGMGMNGAGWEWGGGGGGGGGCTDMRRLNSL